jgi:hypothetical protein
MGCDIGTGPSEAELRRDERLKKMRERLAKTPLAKITADYVPDICLVMQGRTFTDYNHPIDQALERLEGFFKKKRA